MRQVCCAAELLADLYDQKELVGGAEVVMSAAETSALHPLLGGMEWNTRMDCKNDADELAKVRSLACRGWC